MKFISRSCSKFIFVYVVIIFALSMVSWDGAGTFAKAPFSPAANSAFGFAVDNPGIKKAIEVQNRHRERLIGIPGVVGVGTGIDSRGQPRIRVFTQRAGIPGIPQKLEEIPTEVRVTGMFVAYSDPTAKYRPAPIGVSTGHPEITAGTLGARVKDINGNVYALSNNHVYANINDGILGDNALQPGAFDGGVNPGDKIGQLCDYEPIDFSVFGSNTIDAAIVCTTTDEVGSATFSIPEGYGTPNSIIWGDSNSDGFFDNVSDLLDKRVQKFGRTTGLTHGTVTAINVTSTVCYEDCSNLFLAKFAWFDDQILIEKKYPGDEDAFSLGGDSGSLIVTYDGNKNPVGLLFAGSSTTTLANRIDLVLDRYDVSIDGLQPTLPDTEDCSNGVDDDGDEAIDCNDSDCNGDAACTDFEICDDDLDNDHDGDIDCYDIDCEAQCASLYCFKGVLDGNCNPRKDKKLCPDCLVAGQPNNEDCSNNVDDDGDEAIDCNDSDCNYDPACISGDCLRKGSECASDAECCSGICRGIKCK